MAYSDKVLDHYNNPRNVGSMDKSSPDVGTGMVGAPGMRRRHEASGEGQPCDGQSSKTRSSRLSAAAARSRVRPSRRRC